MIKKKYVILKLKELIEQLNDTLIVPRQTQNLVENMKGYKLLA